MTELKKCPFCGGEAKVVIVPRGSKKEHKIRCMNISCAVRPSTPCFIDKEEAVCRWNNRPTEADIRNKAIDEFAEKISLEISESLIWGMALDCDSDKIVDYVIDTAKRVVQQLKGDVE